MALPGKVPEMHFWPGLLALLLLTAVDVPRCQRFVAVAGLVLGKPYQIKDAILPASPNLKLKSCGQRETSFELI